MPETSTVRTARPPLLIALQTEATIFMSLAIGQAGLAAAFISKQAAVKNIHEINAFVMAALSVVMLVTAIFSIDAPADRCGSRWPRGCWSS